MITEGNKQKRQSLKDPAFHIRQMNMDLLFKFSPESPKPSQTRTKKKHDRGFGDWGAEGLELAIGVVGVSAEGRQPNLRGIESDRIWGHLIT